MSRYILIRRLRWPAILLLIGVLALLHQAAYSVFWGLFWPLLLIMMGVLMLAERAALAAEGYPPYSGAPWQGRRNQAPGRQARGRCAAITTGTAIVPSQPHDFENDENGGQS